MLKEIFRRHLKQVDIGFAAEDEIKQALLMKKTSERAVLEFKADCKKMLKTFEQDKFEVVIRPR